MRLSDIMSGLNLAAFPLIAMAIFAVIFFTVVVRVFGRVRPEEFGRAAALPLEDCTAADRSQL